MIASPPSLMWMVEQRSSPANRYSAPSLASGYCARTAYDYDNHSSTLHARATPADGGDGDDGTHDRQHDGNAFSHGRLDVNEDHVDDHVLPCAPHDCGDGDIHNDEFDPHVHDRHHAGHAFSHGMPDVSKAHADDHAVPCAPHEYGDGDIHNSDYDPHVHDRHYAFIHGMPDISDAHADDYSIPHGPHEYGDGDAHDVDNDPCAHESDHPASPRSHDGYGTDDDFNSHGSPDFDDHDDWEDGDDASQSS